MKWLTDHLPADGSVNFADVTTAWSMIGLWGPLAREVLETVTHDDVSNEGIPYGTLRLDRHRVRPGARRPHQLRGRAGLGAPRPVRAGRAPVGHPHGGGQAVRDRAGRPRRVRRHAPRGEVVPAHVHRARARPEPGRGGPRAAEGQGADFIGKAAYLAQREAGPANILCTLGVDDNTSASGERRYMLGHEPICRADGSVVADRNGRRVVRDVAASGPSVGRHLLMAYLRSRTRWSGTSSSWSTSASCTR